MFGRLERPPFCGAVATYLGGSTHSVDGVATVHDKGLRDQWSWMMAMAMLRLKSFSIRIESKVWQLTATRLNYALVLVAILLVSSNHSAGGRPCNLMEGEDVGFPKSHHLSLT